ncbi:hypothetical protein D3C71_1990030 [compost metagenome]
MAPQVFELYDAEYIGAPLLRQPEATVEVTRRAPHPVSEILQRLPVRDRAGRLDVETLAGASGFTQALDGSRHDR